MVRINVNDGVNWSYENRINIWMEEGGDGMGLKGKNKKIVDKKKKGIIEKRKGKKVG